MDELVAEILRASTNVRLQEPAYLYSSLKRKREQKHDDMRKLQKLHSRMNKTAHRHLCITVAAKYGPIPFTIDQYLKAMTKAYNAALEMNRALDNGFELFPNEEQDWMIYKDLVSWFTALSSVYRYMKENNLTM